MRDLAQSSNICLSRDSQILGQSVGEDSDRRRVTTQQLSNKCSLLSHHCHYATLLVLRKRTKSPPRNSLCIVYRYFDIMWIYF